MRRTTKLRAAPVRPTQARPAPAPAHAAPAHAAPARLLAAATTAVLLAGCSTGAVPAPPAAAPVTTAPSADPAAVTWIDGVCGSLLPFVRAVAARPDVGTSDPQATVRGLSGYFGGSLAAADTALTGLRTAGPAPVAGGDAVVTSLTTTLTAFRTSFQDAKTRIDAVAPSDLAGLASALPAALAPLQQLSALPDPTRALASSPELDRAAQEAPDCRQLPRPGG